MRTSTQVPAGRVRRYRRRRWRRRLSPLIRGARARRPALCHRFLGKRASAASHAPYRDGDRAPFTCGDCCPAASGPGFYSVNAMRARHPTWFKEDLEQSVRASAALVPSGRACRADLLRRGRRCSPSPRDWWPRGASSCCARISSSRAQPSAPPENSALQTSYPRIDSRIASLPLAMTEFGSRS